MSKQDAKRVVNRLLDILPSDLLEEITSDMTIPSRRVTASDKAVAASFRGLSVSPESMAEQRQRDAAAHLMHRVAAAMLVDALRVRSAGSGEIGQDAEELVSEVQR